MTSPVSHIICSGALIVLIFTMQFYYTYVVDNIWKEMVQRELKEITDYVSDTLANLYFLANSTDRDVTLEKTLNLPSDIKDQIYVVKIVYNETDRSAQSIDAHLDGMSWVSATSWLPPGLKAGDQNQVISGGKAVTAGCLRDSTDVYVWIKQT